MKFLTHWDQITSWTCPLVVRADFEHQDRWEFLHQSILASEATLNYRTVDFLENVTCRDLSVEGLLATLPKSYQHTFFFLVDHRTLQSPELPVLVVDRQHDPSRTFRTLPSKLAEIACNLSLANMDFFEFADAADENDVFRGFH